MKSDPTNDQAPLRSEGEDTSPPRKAYKPPVVRDLGKVGQVVLSPSPGTFESGTGSGFKP